MIDLTKVESDIIESIYCQKEVHDNYYDIYPINNYQAKILNNFITYEFKCPFTSERFDDNFIFEDNEGYKIISFNFEKYYNEYKIQDKNDIFTLFVAIKCLYNEYLLESSVYNKMIEDGNKVTEFGPADLPQKEEEMSDSKCSPTLNECTCSCSKTNDKINGMINVSDSKCSSTLNECTYSCSKTNDKINGGDCG